MRLALRRSRTKLPSHITTPPAPPCPAVFESVAEALPGAAQRREAQQLPGAVSAAL